MRPQNVVRIWRFGVFWSNRKTTHFSTPILDRFSNPPVNSMFGSKSRAATSRQCGRTRSFYGEISHLGPYLVFLRFWKPIPLIGGVFVYLVLCTTLQKPSKIRHSVKWCFHVKSAHFWACAENRPPDERPFLTLTLQK